MHYSIDTLLHISWIRMMHFVFHFQISKSLQTLINEVTLHICLARIIIIPTSSLF